MGYVTVTADESPEAVVKPILNELLEKLTLPDSITKKHDGSKVTQKTLDDWEAAFPWLEIIEGSGEKRLKCQFCKNFKMNNVFAHEGTPNVQKSSVDRHNASNEHKSAEKMHVDLSVPEFDDYTASDAANVTLDAMMLEDDKCLFRTVYAVAKHEGPTEFVNVMLETHDLTDPP